MVRRAFITGIGIVSSIGCSRDEFWANAVAGRCGIGEIDLFDTAGYRTHLGGQIRGFNPSDHFSRRMIARMSRTDQIGLIAAREAIRDAGLTLADENLERLAISLGAGAGGMISAEHYRRQQIEHPEQRLPRPSLLLSFEASVLTDYLGQETGALGPRTTVVTACSSSATAIGFALDLIRNDEADIVITGGAESLCELTFGGFNSLRSVDPEPCKPFDLNRKGLSLGEGGAILIVEAAERVRMRNAHVYAELLGYALSSDAHHMTAPEPTGTGAVNVMTWALQDANVGIEEIDHVSAHGTATRHNDSIESTALHKFFGERVSTVPVSSLKAMVGHCLGAAGSVEAAALALTIDHGVLLPTIHYRTPDPACDLDVVPVVSRPMKIRRALSNSFAFGGNNTALVMGRHDG